MNFCFPKNFLWGASTSSYQIEGNNVHSDFWEWEKSHGWEPSGRACNSLELWREDIRCLQELGCNAYRLTVSWDRVVPQEGKIDEQALTYYQQLVAELKKAGITPLVGLHHWIQPAWLLKKNPPLLWTNPAIIDEFSKFVTITANAIEADYWVVFNEPMVYLMLGYLSGYSPPGKRWMMRPANKLLNGPIKNLKLAHQRAVNIIKKKYPQALVGIAHNINDMKPLRDPQDAAAVKRWDNFFHWAFLDDLALDFIGVNYYTRVFVRSVPWVIAGLGALPLYPEMRRSLPLKIVHGLLTDHKTNLPKDGMGHEIYPEGLYNVLERTYERYRLPLMITENGLDDAQDKFRGEFIKGHLVAINKALENNIPVTGYLHWSLMDNYEWGSYKNRFGLYHTEPANNYRRLPRPSSRVYADFIRKTQTAPVTP